MGGPGAASTGPRSPRNHRDRDEENLVTESPAFISGFRGPTCTVLRAPRATPRGPPRGNGGGGGPWPGRGTAIIAALPDRIAPIAVSLRIGPLPGPGGRHRPGSDNAGQCRNVGSQPTIGPTGTAGGHRHSSTTDAQLDHTPSLAAIASRRLFRRISSKIRSMLADDFPSRVAGPFTTLQPREHRRPAARGASTAFRHCTAPDSLGSRPRWIGTRGHPSASQKYEEMVRKMVPNASR